MAQRSTVRQSGAGGSLPTRRVGPYELMAEIGRGSHAAVYLARRPGIERLFALKLLPANLDEAGTERVKREAQVASRLDHPGIVRAVDVGMHQGHLYLVMDHVPGHNLQEVIERRGRMEPEEAADLVARIADAVGSAHDAGVVHRDLKPANIIMDGRSGRPMITDFGLARDMSESSNLTQAGEMIGTPYYMAPEQVKGRKVDTRCDVFALGVILYELLTGARPFEGKTLATVCRAILECKPRAPRELVPDVDPTIADVCMRCLSFSPGMRPATASELARRLRGEGSLTAAAPREGRSRPSLVLIAYLAAVGVGVGLLASWGARVRGRVGEAGQALEAARGELALRKDAVGAAEALARADEERRDELMRSWQDAAAARRAASDQLLERRAVLARECEAAAAPRLAIRQAMLSVAKDLRERELLLPLRARLLINCGRARKALEEIQAAQGAGDASVELLVQRLAAAQQLGDQELVKATLAELAEVGPDAPEALFARAILEQDGRHLQRALELGRGPACVYLLAARNMKQMNRGVLERARDMSAAGLRLAPTDVELLYERSEATYHLWLTTGSQDRALFNAFMADLYRAREIRKTSIYWSLAAKSLVQIGQGVGALAEAERAVRIARDEHRAMQAQAQAWLGAAQSLVGDEDAAVAAWQRALDLYPGVARDVIPWLAKASPAAQERVVGGLTPSLRGQVERGLAEMRRGR